MVYQSWSVVFGEQPSAAKWNILGTNDAGFYDGTGFSSGIGHAALLLADQTNSGQTSIASGTFEAKSSLRVMAICSPSTTMSITVRFNGDSANNYSTRLELNGAADATGTSESGISLATSTSSPDNTFVFDVPLNIASREKNIMGMNSGANAGAANAPAKRIFTGKWANTAAQITAVSLHASTGNLGSAQLRVFGA